MNVNQNFVALIPVNLLGIQGNIAIITTNGNNGNNNNGNNDNDR